VSAGCNNCEDVPHYPVREISSEILIKTSGILLSRQWSADFSALMYLYLVCDIIKPPNSVFTDRYAYTFTGSNNIVTTQASSLTTKFRNIDCRRKRFIVDKYTCFSFILYFLLVSCCFHCQHCPLSQRLSLPYPLVLFPILTFLPYPKLLDLVAVVIITKHFTLTKRCLERNCPPSTCARDGHL